MVFKFMLAALALVCCAQMSAANDGRSGSNYFILGGTGGKDYSGERRGVNYVQPQAERGYTGSTGGYSRGGGYGKEYNVPAKYQFAYRARAQDGYGKQGYGSDGYGAGSEFGHSESRDGDRTTGAYFVELPDGRLQRVDYYVDGYSGYVARVSYSGGKGGYSGGRAGYRRETY